MRYSFLNETFDQACVGADGSHSAREYYKTWQFESTDEMYKLQSRSVL
jgi:hypothetical protein